MTRRHSQCVVPPLNRDSRCFQTNGGSGAESRRLRRSMAASTRTRAGTERRHRRRGWRRRDKENATSLAFPSSACIRGILRPLPGCGVNLRPGSRFCSFGTPTRIRRESCADRGRLAPVIRTPAEWFGPVAPRDSVNLQSRPAIRMRRFPAAFHTRSRPSKWLLTRAEFASRPRCPIRSAGEGIRCSPAGRCRTAARSGPARRPRRPPPGRSSAPPARGRARAAAWRSPW